MPRPHDFGINWDAKKECAPSGGGAPSNRKGKGKGKKYNKSRDEKEPGGAMHVRKEEVSDPVTGQSTVVAVATMEPKTRPTPPARPGRPKKEPKVQTPASLARRHAAVAAAEDDAISGSLEPDAAVAATVRAATFGLGESKRRTEALRVSVGNNERLNAKAEAIPASALLREVDLEDKNSTTVRIPVSLKAPDLSTDQFISKNAGVRFELKRSDVMAALATVHPNLKKNPEPIVAYVRSAVLKNVKNSLVVGGGAATLALSAEQPKTILSENSPCRFTGEYLDDRAIAERLSLITEYSELVKPEHLKATEKAQLKELDDNIQNATAEKEKHDKKDGTVMVQKHYAEIVRSQERLIAEYTKQKEKLEASIKARREDAKINSRNAYPTEPNYLTGIKQYRKINELSKQLASGISTNPRSSLKSWNPPAEMAAMPSMAEAFRQVMTSAVIADRVVRTEPMDLFTPDVVSHISQAKDQKEKIVHSKELKIARRLAAHTFAWGHMEYIEFQRFEREHAGESDDEKVKAYKLIKKRIPEGLFQMPDPAVYGPEAFAFPMGTNVLNGKTPLNPTDANPARLSSVNEVKAAGIVPPADSKDVKEAPVVAPTKTADWNTKMIDDPIAAVMAYCANSLLRKEYVDSLNGIKEYDDSVFTKEDGFLRKRIVDDAGTVEVDRKALYNTIADLASTASLTGMVAPLDRLSLAVLPHENATVKATVNGAGMPTGTRGVLRFDLELCIVTVSNHARGPNYGTPLSK